MFSCPVHTHMTFVICFSHHYVITALYPTAYPCHDSERAKRGLSVKVHGKLFFGEYNDVNGIKKLVCKIN